MSTLDPQVVAETPDQFLIRNYLLEIHNKLTGRTFHGRRTQNPNSSHSQLTRTSTLNSPKRNTTSSSPQLHRTFTNINQASPTSFNNSQPLPRLPTNSSPQLITNSQPNLRSNNENLSGPFSLKMSLSQTVKQIHPDITFKVILLGDSGVGKSALFERWKNDLFIPTSATVGMEVFSRYYTCDGKVIQIQVWDTAGQEVYRAITKSYYREVKGALIVFDITQRETFQNVSSWTKELFGTIPDDSKIPVLLIGNKKDLENRRTVPHKEAKDFADNLFFQYIETSAKQGSDCQRSFQLLFQHIYKVHQNQQMPSESNPHLQLHTYDQSLPDPPVAKSCICSF
jgi:Ras-related protein Rab-11A